MLVILWASTYLRGGFLRTPFVCALSTLFLSTPYFIYQTLRETGRKDKEYFHKENFVLSPSHLSEGDTLAMQHLDTAAERAKKDYIVATILGKLPSTAARAICLCRPLG